MISIPKETTGGPIPRAGMVRMFNVTDKPIPTISLTTAEGTQTFAISNPPHVQQPLIQSIVDELNGGGKCPSTGRSGARTARVVDQILAAYREAQSVR